MQWQYTILQTNEKGWVFELEPKSTQFSRIGTDKSKLYARLHQLGAEGWEMMQVIIKDQNTLYYFKKPFTP